jgi:replication factor C subunit 3/5
MLWVDKHRPRTLGELDYHPEINAQFKKMADSGDFPHLLVYGPSGAGKKTRIMAFLREIFGPASANLKVDHKTFKVPSGTTTIDLTTVSSHYHIEMNPSDAGYYDRIVVQEVIKEIAQSPPLDAASAKCPFKVVILNEVERLSKDAQHALRRTMEKYIPVCRLILNCNSTSKVIEPVRSRCLGIRIPAPSQEQVCEVLVKISKKEGLTLPNDLAQRIAIASERNLRKAILMFEATRVAQYPFQKKQEVQQADWEEFIVHIAEQIIQEQSPRRLLEVRAKFYELLSHCIPPEVIIKKLTVELLKKLDHELKYEVIHWAAYYEHRMQCGSKAIYHLEGFVAKFMSIYKRFLINSLSDM